MILICSDDNFIDAQIQHPYLTVQFFKDFVIGHIDVDGIIQVRIIFLQYSDVCENSIQHR